ncbi:MAG: ABC transporter substrate-binding protein [Eubacteriales bacterium]|nr:ABC transporter substrate-binding protein [Eubacteriales bacterium]
MKKIITSVLILVMAIALVACKNDKVQEKTSQGETKTYITITALNGEKEEIQLEVLYNPQRIAVLDLAALDIIDNIGMGERIVGSADNSIEYLSAYVDNQEIADLGTIKEADLEAVFACEPDIIFIGGRLAASYNALSEIAPVVYLATDTKNGVVESVNKNAAVIASIFGLEDDVTAKTADFTSRIDELRKISDGRTALVGMTTSGSFNLLGNDGRCSIIGREAGFNNLTSAAGTASHGNEASFETILNQNPDYIFVMDRDSAIGTAGTRFAKEIMENELVKSTEAYKNGRIIYLENPAVWYTAEGGITALDIMLKDLEKGLN